MAVFAMAARPAWVIYAQCLHEHRSVVGPGGLLVLWLLGLLSSYTVPATSHTRRALSAVGCPGATAEMATVNLRTW